MGFRLLDLPGGDRIHFWLQRHVTKGWPWPDKRLFSFPDRAQSLINDFKKHCGKVPGTVLEIGAGRDLAMPLSLRMLGVKNVIAVDIERLARIDLVNSASSRLLGRTFAG